MKPIIDVTDHNVDAVVTKDVRLSCVVIGGNPTPKVTWSKLGEPISAGEGVIIDDVNGYLLLKKVKVTDGGEYTCVAENIAGNASLIVKLHVQGKKTFSDKYMHKYMMNIFIYFIESIHWIIGDVNAEALLMILTNLFSAKFLRRLTKPSPSTPSAKVIRCNCRAKRPEIQSQRSRGQRTESRSRILTFVIS